MSPIELSRTFSAVAEPSDPDDWSGYFGLDFGRLGWVDLKDKPLTVVLGEAGIGKTVELELETGRMRRAGQAAFFLPLNQLESLESWNLALGDAVSEYERWSVSKEQATFFLDAVDEARLRAHSDFERALSVLQHHLRGQMERARFVVSSRPSDWSLEGVQQVVERRLCSPLSTARATASLTDASESADEAPSVIASKPELVRVEPFVVSLDPLAASEAKLLAGAYEVKDASGFWTAVEDGDYQFMASRPLDLQWLVQLWNAKSALGTLKDLLEFSVSHRLAELNPSYVAAGVVPSADRLREGAEQLAAATELSGRGYVSTALAPTPREGEVSPSAVLQGWGPAETARLLATAVFDEATFGRVRFHHRTLRAFLAACWAKRQLEAGVPFHRIVRLFTVSPFGAEVLVESRRWMLSWLASINVEVREWVARRYPEMLVFDGDPQAWDVPTADTTFNRFVGALSAGFAPNWNNSESEYRRLGLRLSPGLIAQHLTSVSLPWRARRTLLWIARSARLQDCSQQVFGIFRDDGAPLHERRVALEVLKFIATADQRSAITDDLLAGRLTVDALVSAAIPCSNWQSMSVPQLSAVFVGTRTEEHHGTEGLARTVRSDMLPAATAAGVHLLLGAVLAALPRPEAGKEFSRYSESEHPERAWLLDVLPDCFERLLQVLPPNASDYPEMCLEAAERIESLRDSGFIGRDELSRIGAAIAKRASLRWRVALAIAQSNDITHSIGRLTWGTMSCLVSFGAGDASDLVARANDISVAETIRTIWFTVAYEVAFRAMRGSGRRKVLEELCAGPEAEMRTGKIAERRAARLEGLKTSCRWRTEERARKRTAVAALRGRGQRYLNELDSIRDGTNRDALQWLVLFSFNRSERRSFSLVDYTLVAANFGQAVADALEQGVLAVWRASAPRTPRPIGTGPFLGP